ncbi:hypothetical protein D1007_47986 [Hordeum vulgare]|nr:hypothetical protein D1007_47986 [Hordeum vulgare]
MSGDESSFDGLNIDVEQVALRIPLRRPLQDQGGCDDGEFASLGPVAHQRSTNDGGSASSRSIARRRSVGDIVSPSHKARSSDRSRSGRSAPGQVRRPRPPPFAPEMVPGNRRVLVPASGTGHTRTPGSKALAAHRERHRSRERGKALATRRSTSSEPVDPEDALLAGVLRRLLRTTETDARRLRRKNAKALRLAIQLSEREAAKEAAAKTKADRHAKEQDRPLHRLSGIRCSSDKDDNDVSTTSGSGDDDGASPHADAYRGGAQRRGRPEEKGCGEEMMICSTLPYFVNILIMLK